MEDPADQLRTGRRVVALVGSKDGTGEPPSAGSTTAAEGRGASDESRLRRRGLFHQKAAHGVDLCRGGDWESGLVHLRALDELSSELDPVPALAESYLGYALASKGGDYREGLRRCRAAAEREVWEPEIQMNLARTYLVRREKRRAIEALDRGLELDPNHRTLRSLRANFGFRRKPLLPFLGRDNILNRALGALRHLIRPSRPPDPPQRSGRGQGTRP